VWMGLTLGCAQCHDHKYDPFTQKEFYRLYAYFNNLQENGIDGTAGNAVPLMKAPTEAQQPKLGQISHHRGEIQRQMEDRRKTVLSESSNWEEQLRLLKNPPPEPLGMVAHYTFDEQTGEEVTEAMGQQPVAKIVGHAAPAEGKFCEAIEFK